MIISDKCHLVSSVISDRSEDTKSEDDILIWFYDQWFSQLSVSWTHVSQIIRSRTESWLYEMTYSYLCKRFGQCASTSEVLHVVRLILWFISSYRLHLKKTLVIFGKMFTLRLWRIDVDTLTYLLPLQFGSSETTVIQDPGYIIGTSYWYWSSFWCACISFPTISSWAVKWI